MIGCAAAGLTRSPAHRQRIGELTIAGVLIWLVLALVPLPRVLSGSILGNRPEWRELDGREVPTGTLKEFELPSVDAEHPRHANIGDATIDGFPVPASSDLPLESRPRSVVDPGSQHVIGESELKLGLQRNVESVGALPGLPFAPKGSSSPAVRRSSPSNTLIVVATWLFLASVAIAFAWLMLGHVLLVRERLTAAAPPAWLFRFFQRVAEQLTARLPKLVVSHRNGRPLTWGILRPTIALPERICYRANHEQLRTILLHELAHVRRSDARGNLLFEMSLPLLALHPLYWWLRRQVRMSAELLADDWAARQAGREVYVTQLVALARGTNLRRLSLVFGTGVLTNPSQFYRRMKMLLTREKPLTTRLSIFWRLSSAGAVLAAAGLAAAFVGNPAASADEPTKPAAVEPASPAGAVLPSADSKDVPKAEVAPIAGEPPLMRRRQV